MKRKISICTTVAVLFFNANAGYAQQVIGGTTPDAKMLPGSASKAIDMSGIYNPDLYTGSLNVNIPIYPYSSGDINLGVSLAYNTGGVKVDEISSNAGLHWNILAEGSIVRQVKGYADDLDQVVDNVYLDGQYYTKVKGRLACSFENTSQAADTSVLRDQESDEFTVSAGDLSFTFYIGKQRVILQTPTSGIKVELLYNGQPISDVIPQGNSISDPLAIGFRVTDEQGNKYYFEKGDWLQDRLSTQLEAGGWIYSAFYYYTTRWVVTKVTLSNGTEISYNYNQHVANTNVYRSSSVRESSVPATVGSTPISAGIVSTFGYISDIATIFYPNGNQVQFNYETDISKKRCDAPSFMALREIVVSGGNNCLRYRLYQSYDVVKTWSNDSISSIPYGSPCVDLHSNWGNETPEEHIESSRSHRLRLNRITLVSCDGTLEEPFYSFAYDSTALPLRFSGTQDYFGFYNNSTPYLDNFLLPLHANLESPHQYAGADRSPNLSKMKASILTTIKNAYGGKASFSYGLHTGLVNVLTGLPVSDSFFLGENIADGLCIQSVVESDTFHPGNNKVTSFQYSGGQFFLNGGYFHYPAYYADATSASVPVISYTGNFVSPHQLIHGSNHGYSNVTVNEKALLNGTNTSLSRKDFTFTNFKDATSNNQPRYLLVGNGSKDFYVFPYTDKPYLKDWEMGLPLDVLEYDQNGKAVKETLYDYDFFTDTTSAFTAAVENTKVSYVDYIGAPSIWIGPPDNYSWVSKRKITDTYRPFSGEALLKRTITKTYISDAAFKSDTISFKYDSRDNIDSTITSNSLGQKILTLQAYNYNINASSGSALYDMTADGLEKQIGNERWLIGSGGQTTNLLLDANYNTFEYQNGKLWSKRLYNTSIGQPLTYSQYTGYTSGPLPTLFQPASSAFLGNAINYFRKNLETTLYDVKGNALESQLPGLEQYKATIWDIKTQQKLAEASGCRYQDIGYGGFEEGPELSSLVTRGNLIYNPQGTVSTTKLSGRYAFKLHTGGSSLSVTSAQNLAAGQPYHLSLWSTGTVLPTVVVAGSTYLFSSANVVYTKGNWTNYQITITPAVNGTLSIITPGADIYIDEIRLFPEGASMESWTYEPLFGPSSATDVSGRIIFYEYDPMGRQSIVRDQDGNILSMTTTAIGQ